MSEDAGELIAKFREENNNDYGPGSILKRERFCVMMTLEVLKSLGDFVGDKSSDHERGFAHSFKYSILIPFAESGGRGSEALAQLMGLGIIDDFPKFTELPNQYRSQPLKDEVRLEKLKSGETLIDTKIYFDANIPDEEGETCRKENSYSTKCSAETKFKIPNGGLEPLISEMQGKLDKIRSLALSEELK